MGLLDLTTLLSEFLDEVLRGSTAGDVLTANGFDQVPTWQAAGGSATLAHQASVPLTNAQIKTLPTSGVSLVPAAGANRSVLPTFSFAKLDVVVPYTAPIGASWSLITTVDLFKPALSPIVPMKGSLEFAGTYTIVFPCGTEMFFTSTAGDPFEGMTWLGAVSGSAVFSDLSNQPLLLKDDWWGVSNYTDGDDANSAVICVEFRVYDKSVNRFLTTTESGWNQSTRTFA